MSNDKYYYEINVRFYDTRQREDKSFPYSIKQFKIDSASIEQRGKYSLQYLLNLAKEFNSLPTEIQSTYKKSIVKYNFTACHQDMDLPYATLFFQLAELYSRCLGKGGTEPFPFTVDNIEDCLYTYKEDYIKIGLEKYLPQLYEMLNIDLIYDDFECGRINECEFKDKIFSIIETMINIVLPHIEPQYTEILSFI